MKMNEMVIPRKFELSFPITEYETRLKRVRDAMHTSGIDIQIVTHPSDFYWLTGTRMHGQENPSWVIIWDGDPIGVVRHLELETHQCCSVLNDWVEYPDKGSELPYDPVRYTVEKLKDLNIHKKRIGLNFRVIEVQFYHQFQDLLPDAIFTDFRVERIRVVKSKLEQECQFRAVKVNQDSLMNTINEMEVGWSELDLIDNIIRHQKYYLGEDYEASHGMFHVGREHNMHMHDLRWPPERARQKIMKGDIIFLEPGTFVKRYAAGMIRMAYFGDPPDSVKRSAEASIYALNKAIEATAPGKTAHEVDKAARDYFIKMGLDCQGRTGYGIGIEWSESGVLTIRPKNTMVLVPGHIIHLVAINYLPEWGFIGASEQVLVTEDGHKVLADRLRTCPLEFFLK